MSNPLNEDTLSPRERARALAEAMAVLRKQSEQAAPPPPLYPVEEPLQNYEEDPLIMAVWLLARQAEDEAFLRGSSGHVAELRRRRHGVIETCLKESARLARNGLQVWQAECEAKGDFGDADPVLVYVRMKLAHAAAALLAWWVLGLGQAVPRGAYRRIRSLIAPQARLAWDRKLSELAPNSGV